MGMVEVGEKTGMDCQRMRIFTPVRIKQYISDLQGDDQAKGKPSAFVHFFTLQSAMLLFISSWIVLESDIKSIAGHLPPSLKRFQRLIAFLSSGRFSHVFSVLIWGSRQSRGRLFSVYHTVEMLSPPLKCHNLLCWMRDHAYTRSDRDFHGDFSFCLDRISSVLIYL